MSSTTTIDSSVFDLVHQRKSIRAFSSQTIEQEKVNSLLEAARWAPSSMNEQPWRYLYVHKNQQELWDLVFQSLSEGNKIWVKNAPLLLVTYAKKNLSRNDQNNTYAMYDLGAANAFLALQAVHIGLQVHQMGGYNASVLLQNLKLSNEYALGPVIAVGYPGNSEQLPEELRLREESPRVRNEHQHFVLNEVP